MSHPNSPWPPYEANRKRISGEVAEDCVCECAPLYNADEVAAGKCARCGFPIPFGQEDSE